jgi:hypothetical protein
MNKTDGNRKAFLLCVSDYDLLPKNRQLAYVRNDGEVLAGILSKQDYIISENKLIGRVIGSEVRKKLIDFFRRDARSTDTLVFYFSGHGLSDGYGNHFLATSNTDPNIPEEEALNFRDLEDLTRKSNAKRIVLMLDCCFAGSANVKSVGEDIANNARVAIDGTFEEGEGKCILASSLRDQASYKMKNQPFSVFTYYLTEGLKGAGGKSVNQNGIVTPYTLGEYVYKSMKSGDLSNRQKPILKTATTGDIVLAIIPELAKAASYSNEGISIIKNYNDLVEEIIKTLDKAVKRVYFASRFHDPTFLRKLMELLERGVDIRIIDGLPEQISLENRVNSVLRTPPNKETFDKVMDMVNSPLFNVRMQEIPITFLIVDDSIVLYEMINPVNPERFALAVKTQRESYLATQFVHYFLDLWRGGANPRFPRRVQE